MAAIIFRGRRLTVELSRPRRATQDRPRYKATDKCKRPRYNEAPKARVGSNELLGSHHLHDWRGIVQRQILLYSFERLGAYALDLSKVHQS